ncbi:MAG: U32 family peptidase C-terminal domain-containing protein [Patescibacteria group bacterium]
MRTRPELILPAGDPEKARFAFEYGADAVYLGMAKYSMRKTEVRFTISEIKSTIEYAHKLGKRVYITFNIFAHDKHLKTLASDIKKIAKLKPDAFVIADMGVLKIVRENAPEIPIHVSTQQNTVNVEAVKLWKDFGVKRVILARELSLKEIKKIHTEVPDIELEMFVHGAMCISYSGRCLLSAYMTGREANLGDCAQPCRWNYGIIKNSKLKIQNDSEKLYLEEKMRPGEYFPIEESKDGTYLMNSKDLCLIEYLDKIEEAGISGLKIEGRNKSIYYLGVVTRAYRTALDAIAPSRHSGLTRILPELKKELKTLNYRGYTTGFAFGKAKKGETYPSRQPIRNYNFVAVIRPLPSRHSRAGGNPVKPNENWNFIEVRNQIKVGDKIDVITPQGVTKEKVLEITNETGKSLEVINPGKTGQMAYLKLKNLYPEMSLMRKKI